MIEDGFKGFKKLYFSLNNQWMMKDVYIWGLRNLPTPEMIKLRWLDLGDGGGALASWEIVP